MVCNVMHFYPILFYDFKCFPLKYYARKDAIQPKKCLMFKSYLFNV